MTVYIDIYIYIYNVYIYIYIFILYTYSRTSWERLHISKVEFPQQEPPGSGADAVDTGPAAAFTGAWPPPKELPVESSV